MEHVFALDRSWTERKINMKILQLEREKRKLKKLPRLLRRAIKKYRKILARSRGGDFWNLSGMRWQVQCLQQQLTHRLPDMQEVQADLILYRTERDSRLALRALHKVRKRTVTARGKKAKWLEVAPGRFLLRSLRDSYLKTLNGNPASIVIAICEERHLDRLVIRHSTGIARFVLASSVPRGEEVEPLVSLAA